MGECLNQSSALAKTVWVLYRMDQRGGKADGEDSNQETTLGERQGDQKREGNGGHLPKRMKERNREENSFQVLPNYDEPLDTHGKVRRDRWVCTQAVNLLFPTWGEAAPPGWHRLLCSPVTSAS